MSKAGESILRGAREALAYARGGGHGLSPDEIERFRTTGLLFPKRALSGAETAACLGALEGYERRSGRPVQGKWRYKSHLVFPWISQIMRQPRILDMVAALIGPDIMVWSSHLYPKEPGDGRFISWHQDSAHWGLDSEQIMTVWIALTPATVENGCMRALPASHRHGTVGHRDTWDPVNILTRGQIIEHEIDEGATVSLLLEPGECSIHHVNLYHASHPNRSDDRRVGLAIRYITPKARQQRADTDFATLVRGQDNYGHFELEPEPSEEMDPAFVDLHARIGEIQGQIYLAGTERAGLDGLAETNTLDQATGRA